jgi:peptidyl-dipeptidase A
LARFGISPGAMLPALRQPFSSRAAFGRVNLDEFYEKKSKEEIVRIAREFYQQLGLPADDILRRSDLYEREGKDQHAFCTSINRADDVRTLCNIKPTAEWMDTTLHELGHAVYDVGIDRSLPYNIREPSHAFTTEGVAMLFGSLAKTPSWIIRCTGADEARVGQVAAAIREQRRREQLIFARWTLVMLASRKPCTRTRGRT